MLHRAFKKLLLSLALLFSFRAGFSQSAQNSLKEAKSLPLANINVKINNVPFSKHLELHKDSLVNGFRLSLSDSTYKIVSFLFTHDSRDRDIPEKIIYGNQVTVIDAPVLKSLKAAEALVFSYLKIERNGKFFTLPDFIAMITD